VIGSGSQGIVFSARRARDDRAVAVKVIPLHSNDQRLRLARELELHRDLAHPALLTFDTAGELPDSPAAWFETELCRGSVLDLLNHAAAPLPAADACRIVLDALDGLVYLHDRGVVHRDLKPSNLLIRTSDRVVIGDLGLAKLLARPPISAADTFGGTAAFAAPEQLARFRDVTVASDVWSMAATLYFLRTLELPRDQAADQDEFTAARDNPVVPIAERWPGVPGRLASCIDRALSPHIKRRPGHARELQDALVGTLSGVL
jgi:serine/threonine protein kinase